MFKGKHGMKQKRKSGSMKPLLMSVALTLVLCSLIGGTVAWLIADTDPVVNTFTYGDINIDLTETTGNQYKMIPGADIDKDPKVTVQADSEACWLFIKIDKSANYNNYLEDYAIASGWTLLEEGVYSREVDEVTAKAGAEYWVLDGNRVTVKSSVTKAMMENIKNGVVSEPTLSFTAYAVQREGFATPAAAWAEVTI